MTQQELKSYSVVASSEAKNYLDGEINLAFEAYDADEVDAVLAEKDAEIRRLQRALWLMRAENAKKSINFWNERICTVGNSTKYDIRGYNITNKVKRFAKEWRALYKNVERKCRAKAEEYK